MQWLQHKYRTATTGVAASVDGVADAIVALASETAKAAMETAAGAGGGSGSLAPCTTVGVLPLELPSHTVGRTGGLFVPSPDAIALSFVDVCAREEQPAALPSILRTGMRCGVWGALASSLQGKDRNLHLPSSESEPLVHGRPRHPLHGYGLCESRGVALDSVAGPGALRSSCVRPGATPATLPALPMWPAAVGELVMSPPPSGTLGRLLGMVGAHMDGVAAAAAAAAAATSTPIECAAWVRHPVLLLHDEEYYAASRGEAAASGDSGDLQRLYLMRSALHAVELNASAVQLVTVSTGEAESPSPWLPLWALLQNVTDETSPVRASGAASGVPASTAIAWPQLLHHLGLAAGGGSVCFERVVLGLPARFTFALPATTGAAAAAGLGGGLSIPVPPGGPYAASDWAWGAMSAAGLAAALAAGGQIAGAGANFDDENDARVLVLAPSATASGVVQEVTLALHLAAREWLAGGEGPPPVLGATDLAAMPLAAQLSLLRRTRVLVSVHGAGLAYMLGMRTGGAVLEVRGGQWGAGGEATSKEEESRFGCPVWAGWLRHACVQVRCRARGKPTATDGSGCISRSHCVGAALIAALQLVRAHDAGGWEWADREKIRTANTPGGATAGRAEANEPSPLRSLPKAIAPGLGLGFDLGQGQQELASAAEDAAVFANTAQTSADAWAIAAVGAEKTSECAAVRRRHGVVPGVTWGVLPEKLQDEWKRHNCDDALATAGRVGPAGAAAQAAQAAQTRQQAEAQAQAMAHVRAAAAAQEEAAEPPLEFALLQQNGNGGAAE
jgi:hypothetical protein